jgi:hypothetical protein
MRYSYSQIGNSDGRQIINGSNIGFLRGDHLPDSFLKSGNKTIKYEDINGTPYIDNKQELIHNIPTGKLYTSGNEYINSFFIRYNAYSDNMELSLIDDGIEYFLLKKQVDAWYVILGKHTYRTYDYIEENKNKLGFFVIISKGDSKYCTLLKKEIVTFKDAVAQQNAFITASPPSFSNVKNTYFIKIGDAVQKVPKKNILSEKLKKRKYNLSKEKDLLEIVNYYNSIVN